MKRTERFLHRWTTLGDAHFRALLVLGSSFFAGGLLGLLAASWLGEVSCGELDRFFRSYIEVIPDASCTWSGFFRTLWYFTRIPLLLLLTGFSALGVLVIPASLLWKGFSFSFAVSALAKLYGVPGLAAAAVCFGLADLVFIPLLFWIGGWNWEVSCQIAFGKGLGEGWPVARIAVPGVCAVLLGLSTAVFFSFRLLALLLAQCI